MWHMCDTYNCAPDNHNYVCHTCAKEFLKFALQVSSYLQKYQFFMILPQILHFHKNRNCSSIFATF